MEPKSLSDLPGVSTALVDALIATSHSLVCVLDPSGRILRFNRVCEEVTGYSSRELVGENARDWVIPPEERELFDAVLEEIWEAKRPSPQVGQWLARDGRRVTVAWSNMPLWNPDGSPACLVTAGLRIGERDRAEAEMQSLHTLLESRLGELTRLAAEQSALRRVATLVATETGPEAIFDAVSGEMARLVGSRSSAVFRYGRDASATVVGRYTEDGITAFALGSSVSLEADSALARVYRTGAPIRIESYAGVEGDVGEAMRQLGFNTSVAAPIIVGETRWGAVVVTGEDAASLPSGTEHRLHQFAELISLAIVSAEAREELLASRARVVQAGDAERRRLQRNLHDGAQQRLVSLLLALRLARKRLVDGEDADELLGAAVADAEAAVEELRELARGLHPAILTRDGLRLAVEVLGRRAPFPVDIDVTSGTVPEPLASAVYYLVAEALTNAAKHAEATRARVSVQWAGGELVVEVVDDGCGGASTGEVGGLRGLHDRVEAILGSLSIDSAPDCGTTIRATFPAAPE